MKNTIFSLLLLTNVFCYAQDTKKYDTVKCLVQTIEGEYLKLTKAWAVRGYEIAFYQQIRDTMRHELLGVRVEPIYNSKGHIVAFLDSKKQNKLTNIWQPEGHYMQYVFKNW